MKDTAHLFWCWVAFMEAVDRLNWDDERKVALRSLMYQEVPELDYLEVDANGSP